MSADVAHVLRDRVREVAAERPYHQLVLVVGNLKSGKTTALRTAAADTDWAVLGLGSVLAERLLHVPTRQRPTVVQQLAQDVAREATGDVIAIDNLELLFHPGLAVGPPPLLLALPRHRVVVDLAQNPRRRHAHVRSPGTRAPSLPAPCLRHRPSLAGARGLSLFARPG